MAMLNESVIYLGEFIDSMDSSRSGVNTRSQTQRTFKSGIPLATVDLTRDIPGPSTASTPLATVDLTRQSLTSSSSSNRQSTKRSYGNAPSKRMSKDKNRENCYPTPECPVCLEPLVTLQLKAAHCGHVFCVDCIDVITAEKVPKCPKCRKIIIISRILPIYF